MGDEPEIIKKEDASKVIFIVKTSSQWQLVRQSLKNLDNFEFNLLNILVIVRTHPTVLRAHISGSEDVIHKVNILISYSGYYNHAEYLIKMLSSGEKFNKNNSIPIDLPELSTSPDWTVKNGNTTCLEN